MSNLENLNHEEEAKHVNDLWEKENKSQVLVDLKNGLSFQEIVDKNYTENVADEPERFECCDGRCPHEKGKYKAFAGSGILLSPEELDKMIKSNPKIKCITAHIGCGAGNLVFERAKLDGTLPERISTADQYVEWWTKTTAAKYNLEYQFILAENFDDGEIHHHELGIAINFDPKNIPGMPNVFVSHSAGCLSDDSFKEETEALTKIAFSKHGFGGRFTKEKPFHLFLRAEDEAEQDHLVTLAKEAIKSYEDKVVVDGFISPF